MRAGSASREASISPAASKSLRRGSQPSPPTPRPGRPPVPPRAYLVLDLGGEPVGRALVEVGHGCSDHRKGLRSESGSVTLGVPALSPQLWPRG